MDITDQKIIDKLVTARIALLLKHPFFGNLATRLKLINADEWCPTAGTAVSYTHLTLPTILLV